MISRQSKVEIGNPDELPKSNRGGMKLMTSLRSIFLALAIVPLGGSVPLSAQAPQAQSPLEKAWDILRTGTNEKSSDKRTNAVRALGLIPNDTRAAETAEKALKDEKPDVRSAGATALGEMLSKSSIPKLKEALSDRDIGVVLAAARSLVALHDDDGYELYYELLTGEYKRKEGRMAEPSAVVKDRKKLGEFCFEQGVGFFWFTDIPYTAIKFLSKDDVTPVRAAAVKVLADDPHPHSAQALAKAASDKSWVVRAAAVWAIARRGDPFLLDSVLPDLSDEKDLVRYTAAAAVIRLSAAKVTAENKVQSE